MELLKVQSEVNKQLVVLCDVIDVCMEYQKGAEAKSCMDKISEIIDTLSE